MTLKNRAVVQARRLRSPRTLIAAVAGAGYMWWFLFRPAAQPVAGVVLGGALDWPLRVASLAVTLLPAYWWLAGAGKPAAAVLAFTPAEEHLLFPAPVTRRGLVHWKLWRAQLAVLFNTVLFTVLLRGGAARGGAWGRALALWLILSTLQLHRLAAALVTAPARDDAPRRALARWGPAVIVAAIGAAIAVSVFPRREALSVAWDVGPLMFGYSLGAALGQGPAWWALWPGRALLTPLFALGGPGGALGEAAGNATGRPAWAAALPAAVLLLLLHYAWVLRVDRRLTEVALDAAEARRSRRRGATSATRRTLTLSPIGVPGVAIVWKNWLAFSRATALTRILGLLGLLAAAALVLGARSAQFAELATLVAATWGGLLVVLGPLWVRYDLRHDLPHLPFLKALPLPGRALMAAEVGASTLALTAVQYLALVFLLLASLRVRDGMGLSGAERGAYALGLGLVLPGINAATLAVQNGVALLFPAWVRSPGGQTRGIEATGQNLVGAAMTLGLAGVLLAGPAAAGAAVVMGLRRVGGALGPWAVLPGAVVSTLGAGVALWPVLGWLGRVFERTDPVETSA